MLGHVSVGTHICCMYRGQKMMSWGLFNPHLFLCGRTSRFLDSHVLSQAGRQQVPAILLCPGEALGLWSEVCMRCLDC